MSSITLKQLEAFVQVAKLGSFRKAASALNTTQPNISARISKLEEQFGQTLMKRDPGSVALTNHGKHLLEKSQRVLTAVDDLLASTQSKTLFEGTLRVGVTETIAHSWLGEFLSSMAESFPNVTLELRVDISSELTRVLNENEIDLALQNGPFREESANPIHLGTYSLTWVAAPNYAMPEGKLSKQQIAEHSILSHSRDTAPFQQLEEHFRSTSIAARLVPSNSVTACLEMTRQGIGIACLPSAIVQGELDRGTLVELDYQWVPDSLKFEARYNQDFVSHYVKEAANIAAETSQKHQAQ